jgi:hypothetical protein
MSGGAQRLSIVGVAEGLDCFFAIFFGVLSIKVLDLVVIFLCFRVHSVIVLPLLI